MPDSYVQPRALAGTANRLIRIYLKDFAILVGGVLLSVQTILQFRPNHPPAPTYQAHPPHIYLVIAGALVVCIGGQWLLEKAPFLPSGLRSNHPYFVLLAATGLSGLIINRVTPEFSRFQIVCFGFGAALLGFFFLVFPRFLATSTQAESILDSVRTLWSYRALIRLWVKYNVISRYSQAILGILWIVLLPLSSALILAFVFSQVLDVRTSGSAPFVVFFLVALVHWNLFSQSISQGTVSVLTAMGIINQVYFPREILLIIKVFEALADFTFMFGSMLIINALYGIFPNIFYVLLPLLLLIQLTFTLGLILLSSYLAVFIRDIPQLVAVVMQLAFYMTPIMYPIELVPAPLRFEFSLNPLAALIAGYRDIIIYGRAPDPTSLFIPAVLAITTFYVGYKAFKANEHRLADFI